MLQEQIDAVFALREERDALRTENTILHTKVVVLEGVIKANRIERDTLKAALEALVGASQKAHIAYMTDPQTGWIPAMDELFKAREQAQSLLEK